MTLTAFRFAQSEMLATSHRDAARCAESYLLILSVN